MHSSRPKKHAPFGFSDNDCRIPKPMVPIMETATADKLIEAYYRPMFEDMIDIGNVSQLMQGFGYTKNPLSCPHDRKRFKTKWVCLDCGTDL